MKLAVGPDFVMRGTIVDPSDPAQALDPVAYEVRWPTGFSAAVVGGRVEVRDATGSVVARDGAVLKEPAVCKVDNSLWISSPGTLVAN